MSTPKSLDSNQDQTVPAGAPTPAASPQENASPAKASSEPVEETPLENTPSRESGGESAADAVPPKPAVPGRPGVPGEPSPDAPADDLEHQPSMEEALAEEGSFATMLSEFEQEHQAGSRHGGLVEGTIIGVTSNSVFVDIGIKREGVLPLDDLLDEEGKPTVKTGDTITVTIAGRSSDGYYRLSTAKVEQPKDWRGLERAFADKSVINGTVSEVIKGGLAVDIGTRAFMPASRSGTRDAAEMEALVGQEIRCKIIQLDPAKDDVVVDRRAVIEQEAAEARAKRLAEIQEGAVLTGVVRTLTDFGAFVDLGGVDGLLHVTDMAWHRVKKPSDLLKEGEPIEVKVLKVSPDARKISLGRKQLIPDPWNAVGQKYKAGDKVKGKVVRLTDFGAFVELEPGVDGMVHISEMSWTKRIQKPSDVLRRGETVEVVVLNVDGAKRRIALGLKQLLGDPWDDIETKFPVGSVVEGKVTNLAKFGAFVELTEGVEGMIHVADITHEKRLDQPSEALSVGQVVKAAVVEIDRARKRIRLSIKRLEPTSVDEYIAEHKVDDVVTGRVVDAKKGVRVELGEGVTAVCRPRSKKSQDAEKKSDTEKPDLPSLTAMLAAKWKEGAIPAGSQGSDALRSGQVRSFRILSMDPQQKRIEVELSD